MYDLLQFVNLSICKPLELLQLSLWIKQKVLQKFQRTKISMHKVCQLLIFYYFNLIFNTTEVKKNLYYVKPLIFYNIDCIYLTYLRINQKARRSVLQTKTFLTIKWKRIAKCIAKYISVVMQKKFCKPLSQ